MMGRSITAAIERAWFSRASVVHVADKYETSATAVRSIWARAKVAGRLPKLARRKPKIDPANVTVALVRRLLAYDPETGLFVWRVNRGGTARAGTVAGSPDRDGYVLIRIGNRNFKAHRLAWLHVHGVWPSGDIDHERGNPGDNRLAKLRDLSHSQNLVNNGLHGHNTSGVSGVGWHKGKKKWRAFMQRNGRFVHLGYFGTKSEAVAARKTAAEGYVGGPVRSPSPTEQTPCAS